MAESDAPKKQRLNPFAFPSETNVRFTLLVIAALMLAFDVGLSAGVLKLNTPAIDANLNDPVSVEKGLVEWNQTLVQSALPGVLILSLLILATIIYRVYPNRIRRKKNLQLMTRSSDPKYMDAIQNLVSLSGISPAPSIEAAPGLRSVDGQAFGLPNHYILRLGGRLRLLLRQNPDSFRAIVLHELGHIANADVARAYFAQAIWIAVVSLTIIPIIAFIAFNFIQGLTEKLSGGMTSAEWTRLFTLNIPTIIILLLQFSGTLAIIAAIRGSLLRVREVYADWRAALWGAEAPLSDILRRNPSNDKTPNWTRAWMLHPTTQDRLTALQNPERLFHVTLEQPFFVGALLGYMLSGALALFLYVAVFLSAGQAIGIMQFQLTIGFDDPRVTFEALSLVFSAISAAIVVSVLVLGFWIIYLVAGALGLEVQREAIADLTTGRRGWVRYLSLSKPAGLAAVGFQVGSLLTPLSFLGLLPQLINFRGLTVLLIIILLITITTSLTWLGLIYIRFFARRTLGLHVGTLSPHGARRLLTLVLSGLLLASYLPSVIGQSIILGVILSDTSTVTFGNTTMLTQTTMIWLFGITVITALFLYAITFGATWLLMQAYQLIQNLVAPLASRLLKSDTRWGRYVSIAVKTLLPGCLSTSPQQLILFSALPIPHAFRNQNIHKQQRPARRA